MEKTKLFEELVTKLPSPVKSVARWIIPYGLVYIVHKKVVLPYRERERQRERQRKIEPLLKKWDSINQQYSSWRPSEITREEIIALLSSWGLDAQQIDSGSIPTPDLDAICNFIRNNHRNPLIGVHVGNFVGVSLAYITTRLKKMGEQNVIISIDPNLTHRGISNTEEVVTKLLRVIDVQDVVVRVTGYSLNKSVSNDGVMYDTNYDSLQHFLTEDAPEWQLKNLLKIIKGKVDFIMLDGNHDPDYLREEVRICYELLYKGGAIFLDDINEIWYGLKQVFNELGSEQIFSAQFIGTRTGVLVKN